MSNATFYLAVSCFALGLLSADRLFGIVLTTIVALIWIAYLGALGVIETVKQLTTKLTNHN